MAAKHFEPTFKSEVERACYRFIFEEECVKEYYNLLNDGELYNEVMWEIDDSKLGIIVRLEDADNQVVKIKFGFKKFPALADFLDNMGRVQNG